MEVTRESMRTFTLEKLLSDNVILDDVTCLEEKVVSAASSGFSHIAIFKKDFPGNYDTLIKIFKLKGFNVTQVDDTVSIILWED